MKILFSEIGKKFTWVIDNIKAHSNVLYTIFTGIIMVVMFITMCQQGKYNQRQQELEELRAHSAGVCSF